MKMTGSAFQGLVLFTSNMDHQPLKEWIVLISNSTVVHLIIANSFQAMFCSPFSQSASTQLAQCRKTVMTPLKNFGRTRAIEGHFFNENLWPKLQLYVIGYKVLLQNLLKTFIFRVFSCYLPNRMKNSTLFRLFFDLYLAFKGDQNTFYIFQSSN